MTELYLTGVDDINREIFLNIADDIDLINIFETNKYAAEIYKDDKFWNQRIQRIYGYDFNKYLSNIDSLTYKQIYDKIREHNGDLAQVFINCENDKYLPLVKFIIEENKVNFRRNIGDPGPLDKLVGSASGLGQIDILKYLLQDSEIINPIGDDSSEFHVLISAARSGHIKSITYLVEELGLLINADREELCTAAEEGHLGIVQYLLEKGAYNQIDKDDALMTAADGGNTEIVKYLIEEIGLDPHADNDYVLTVAAECNQLLTVKYLIEIVGLRNINSALGMAHVGGFNEMTEYLKSIEH